MRQKAFALERTQMYEEANGLFALPHHERPQQALRSQVKRGLEIRRARQCNVVVPIVPPGYALRVRRRRAAPARTSRPPRLG